MASEEVDSFDEMNPSEWTLMDEAANAYVADATAEVASLVRSTLGPRGMEKLVDTYNLKNEPEIVRTANGEEILAAIERGEGFNHPAAALFVDTVDSMQRTLHDGTTTAILLTNELVSRGVDLLEQGVHPTTIVLGYAIAADRAGRVLDDLARPVGPDDDLLKAVAATTFPEDLSSDRRSCYTRMAVRAVRGLADAPDGWIDTENVKVLSRPGSCASFHRGVVVQRFPQGGETLDDGFDWTPVVESPVYDQTVAILDREIDLVESAASFQQNEHMDFGGVITSPERFETYQSDHRASEERTADSLREMGVDVLVCREQLKSGIRRALERVDIIVVDWVNTPEVDIERLSEATGAAVVSRPSELTPERLGTVGRLDEFKVDDEKWAVFDECDGTAYTIVTGGMSATSAAHHERLVRGAIEAVALAVMDDQVIPGAGAPAMAVAADLREAAPSIASREQLVVEAFADALEELVCILAENLGGVRTDVLALHSAHARDGNAAVGLGLEGKPVDAWETGVVEPRRVFSYCIETARTVAEELLTIDAVVYPNVDLQKFDPLTGHD